jgi:hypothetical protein
MTYPIESTRVVRYSTNRKLGHMAATYRAVGPTCPNDCALLGNGCYAGRGFVKFAARGTFGAAGDLDTAAGVDIVRHVVSGDWLRPWGGGKRLDIPYFRRVTRWHLSQPRTHGFGYTHAHNRFDAAGHGPTTWPRNFNLLASVDSLHARKVAKGAGWQTARVIDEPADIAGGERLCPYDAARRAGHSSPQVTCRTCRLCIGGLVQDQVPPIEIRRHPGPDIAFLKF